jgi:hypothetical protein
MTEARKRRERGNGVQQVRAAEPETMLAARVSATAQRG